MKNLMRVLFAASLTVLFFSQGYAQATDKNVPDNGSAGTAVQGKFVDANANGICDHHEAKDGKCANFVDKDGNGVCDNCGTANCEKKANCQGHEKMSQAGCGHGEAKCGGQGSGQGGCCQAKKGANAVPTETSDPKK